MAPSKIANSGLFTSSPPDGVYYTAVWRFLSSDAKGPDQEQAGDQIGGDEEQRRAIAPGQAFDPIEHRFAARVDRDSADEARHIGGQFLHGLITIGRPLGARLRDDGAQGACARTLALGLALALA